jgi:hypothetical protein
MSKVYVKMPDGRRFTFNTLKEYHKFMDKEERLEKKQKAQDTSVFATMKRKKKNEKQKS